MKKIFLVIVLLLSFSFCLTERPTGYQLEDSGNAALWIAFINNVDALGANTYSNLGLDFIVSENFEMSFDLGRKLGTEFLESSQTLQFRWWISSNLSLSVGKDFGNNHSDSNFLGAKFLKGNSWLAFTRDSGNDDNSTWSLGKLWNRKGKMNVSISYHFSAENIDKGNLQLALGKTI